MNKVRYVLTSDVYSYKRKLYAAKGTIVICAAKHGRVLIVKTATDKRFPIHAEALDTYHN
ncbi:MAG TPA: hypothetical protein PK772_08420 [Chitinophagaceae bacterium]|nr:hypothetical protein [Chitinophagaceae bacterium]